MYVVIIAPHVVNASKKGNAALVYFSNKIPDITAKIITEKREYK